VLLWSGGAAVVLVLLWLLTVPAIRILWFAKGQEAQRLVELTKMQSLANEAKWLSKGSVPSGFDRRAALEQVSRGLGAGATWRLEGDGAQLTLANIGAGELAKWLSDTRTVARCEITQMKVTRAPGASSAGPTWSGNVLLRCPS
jgi:type II secretory pathway component PulM